MGFLSATVSLRAHSVCYVPRERFSGVDCGTPLATSVQRTRRAAGKAAGNELTLAAIDSKSMSQAPEARQMTSRQDLQYPEVSHVAPFRRTTSVRLDSLEIRRPYLIDINEFGVAT
jgi:hypothetical protein